MNSNILHFVIILCASVVVVIASTGCKNTANGAGKDIEHMGEKIQEKTK